MSSPYEEFQKNPEEQLMELRTLGVCIGDTSNLISVISPNYFLCLLSFQINHEPKFSGNPSIKGTFLIKRTWTLNFNTYVDLYTLRIPKHIVPLTSYVSTEKNKYTNVII